MEPRSWPGRPGPGGLPGPPAHADGDPLCRDGADQGLGGVDAAGGHKRRVLDPVDAGGHRVGDGPGAMGMRGDGQPVAVGLVDDDPQRPGAELRLVRQ
jgi:hypothetical protein